MELGEKYAVLPGQRAFYPPAASHFEMYRQSLRLLAIVVLTASNTALVSLPLSASDDITPAQRDFFENEIRPILAAHCLDCHTSESDEPEANLRLDSREGWSTGGDSGAAIVSGKPDDSLIMEAIHYENTDLQMPPDGKLSDKDIASLTKWIEMGAPDPRSATVDKTHKPAFDIQQRRNSHWCWQPIQTSDPPPVSNQSWPAKPLDRYVLAQLEQAKLSPAPPADRATLLRRVTFDLIGLPPTPAELSEFLADPSDDAYAKVVTRLLESPHFGEHWGQHWLDLVRYAETRGHEQDYVIPEAYRFRDYVINAFNENVPYDRFLIEHVAGDLVEKPRLHPEDRTNQSIQGTGFWHLHEQTHSPVDIQGDEADRIHNQIDVFSRTFLGLSVGCARCHDHKFDAISAKDYYALYGYLQSSSYRVTDVSDPEMQRTAFEALQQLNEENAAALTEALTALRVAQLEKLPEMLLVAEQLIRDGKPLDAPQKKADETAKKSKDKNKEKPAPPKPSKEVVAAAERSGFETIRLWKLAKHLVVAAKSENVRDPLHVFARIAQIGDANKEQIKTAQSAAYSDYCNVLKQNASKRANQTVVKSVKDGERNYRPVERDWMQSDLVEDFQFDPFDSHADSDGSQRRWITDGYRFGDRPQVVGTPLLTADPSRPIHMFLDEPAAQTVSSRFQGFIRTRTFEVVGDRLWYRYRGNAEAFLAVDSHRVVAGPLHGVVKQKLNGDTNQWRWHAHNVRDYIGHRVHVEFRPSAEFAVDQVVFSTEQPPDPKPGGRGILKELALRQNVGTIADVARQTASRMRSVIQRNKPDLATLNWLLVHGDLLPSVEGTQAQFDQVAKQYVDARKEIEDRIPSPVRALSLLDGDAEDEPVHIRGNHRNKSQDYVSRSNLSALRGDGGDGVDGGDGGDGGSNPGEPNPNGSGRVGSGRMDLARELVRRENPLVARVFVNRIWHHLFGRGIVETVDDFGVMGKEPTHPALLDHLATKFMDDGWRIKEAIRDIVLSQSYQMSSYPDDASVAADPTNRLFHRMPVRRLPAESIRDHILAVSGRLDRKMFGKSTMVHITPYMRGNRSPGGSGPLDGDGRRSIYTEVRRNHLSAFLTAFDKPAPFMAIGKRTVSNSPAQSLILLNDPFVHEQASLWAKQLVEAADSDEARLETAYLWAFSREPTENEREATLAFVAGQRKEYKDDSDVDVRAWTDLCHTLFNVKEFVHIN